MRVIGGVQRVILRRSNCYRVSPGTARPDCEPTRAAAREVEQGKYQHVYEVYAAHQKELGAEKK